MVVGPQDRGRKIPGRLFHRGPKRSAQHGQPAIPAGTGRLQEFDRGHLL